MGYIDYFGHSHCFKLTLRAFMRANANNRLHKYNSLHDIIYFSRLHGWYSINLACKVGFRAIYVIFF